MTVLEILDLPLQSRHVKNTKGVPFCWVFCHFRLAYFSLSLICDYFGCTYFRHSYWAYTSAIILTLHNSRGLPNSKPFILYVTFFLFFFAGISKGFHFNILTIRWAKITAVFAAWTPWRKAQTGSVKCCTLCWSILKSSRINFHTILNKSQHCLDPN